MQHYVEGEFEQCKTTITLNKRLNNLCLMVRLKTLNLVLLRRQPKMYKENINFATFEVGCSNEVLSFLFSFSLHIKYFLSLPTIFNLFIAWSLITKDNVRFKCEGKVLKFSFIRVILLFFFAFVRVNLLSCLLTWWQVLDMIYAWPIWIDKQRL